MGVLLSNYAIEGHYIVTDHQSGFTQFSTDLKMMRGVWGTFKKMAHFQNIFLFSEAHIQYLDE